MHVFVIVALVAAGLMLLAHYGAEQRRAKALVPVRIKRRTHRD